MPIYEYVCMKCESHFEELVRGDEEPSCPDCGATKVAQPVLRLRHEGRGSTAELPLRDGGGGGGCCGGSCGCGH